MDGSSFNSLLEILRSHDVSYDRNAIKSAFDDPDSSASIQEWMDKYLRSETLLTREEAALYAALSKNGHAGDPGASTQELSDQQIQDAVEELKRSTAAIEKHTKALQLQQSSVDALVERNMRTSRERSKVDRRLREKWDLERARLSATVEELSQSLKYQTSDLEQQDKESEASVKLLTENLLRSDDKLLAGMQKLVMDLDPARSPESEDVIPKLKGLCARLIKHTVEAERVRLDRIYLEALNNSKYTADDYHDGQEVTDLEAELESIYTEILPVAQMSTEQQYLAPALHDIALRDGQNQERWAKSLDYIHECLVFLVSRVEAFLERVHEHRCHKMAVQFAVEAAKRELLQPPSASKTDQSAKPPVQIRRKSSSSQSPVRLRAVRRRSSTHLDEDIEPEDQLLRNIGASLPMEPTSELLEQILHDRKSKLEGHATNLQSNTESYISSHLLDAHLTLRLLQDSLLSESRHGTVELIDPDVESSITRVERDIHHLTASLEAADLETLQTSSVKREQLVSRWSRP